MPSATNNTHKAAAAEIQFNSLAVEIVITANDFASEDGDLRRRRISERVIERHSEPVVP